MSRNVHLLVVTMVVLVLSSAVIGQERQAIDIAALGPQVGDRCPTLASLTSLVKYKHSSRLLVSRVR